MIKVIADRHHESFERRVNEATAAGWYRDGRCQVFQCEDGSFLYVAFLTRADAIVCRAKSKPFILPDPDAPIARGCCQPVTYPEFAE